MSGELPGVPDVDGLSVGVCSIRRIGAPEALAAFNAFVIPVSWCDSIDAAALPLANVPGFVRE